MPRNLVRRVELLVPIEDQQAKRRLKDVLFSYSKDNVKGRCLQSDGHYHRVWPRAHEPPHHHQRYLHEQAVRARPEMTKAES